MRPSLCQGHYSQLLSSSLLAGGKGILFTITPRPHLWTHNLPSGPVFALSHTHTHAHTHTNTHQFLFHLAYFNFIIHFSIVSQWRVSDRLVWTQKASVIQGKIEWYNGGGSKGFVARKHTSLQRRKAHIFNRISVKCGKHTVGHFGFYISTEWDRSRLFFTMCITKISVNAIQNMTKKCNILKRISMKCGKYNMKHLGFYITTVWNRSKMLFTPCIT